MVTTVFPDGLKYQEVCLALVILHSFYSDAIILFPYIPSCLELFCSSASVSAERSRIQPCETLKLGSEDPDDFVFLFGGGAQLYKDLGFLPANSACDTCS